jgi:nicotinamide riboside kinase
MKRIVITGAECTGKSTLAQALSGYYGEPWTPEFVRIYVERVQRELEASDLPEIFVGQLAQEDASQEKAKRYIFHDTNLLSSILYGNHYFGRSDDAEQALFLSRDYALYLLCSPEGIAWADDPGQRDSPEAREALQRKFRETLETLQLPYIELSGELSARMGEAVQAVDALL